MRTDTERNPVDRHHPCEAAVRDHKVAHDRKDFCSSRGYQLDPEDRRRPQLDRHDESQDAGDSPYCRSMEPFHKLIYAFSHMVRMTNTRAMRHHRGRLPQLLVQ